MKSSGIVPSATRYEVGLLAEATRKKGIAKRKKTESNGENSDRGKRNMEAERDGHGWPSVAKAKEGGKRPALNARMALEPKSG